MKAQMKTLFKELQQAQSKLDEAEGMKKNLQDRLEFFPNENMRKLSSDGFIHPEIKKGV